jgi:hypothetical protein
VLAEIPHLWAEVSVVVGGAVGRSAQGFSGGVVVTQVVGLAVEIDQRNAKLQLTVLLAPTEAVPGLYLHPEHRRRLRRPAVRGEFSV